jgi:hypothetical protein
MVFAKLARMMSTTRDNFTGCKVLVIASRAENRATVIHQVQMAINAFCLSRFIARGV